jgi:hypothetical protein
VVRRLGERPVSTYLACGSGLTGPNADSWHVYYNLGLVVGPAANRGSTLSMTFTAEAIDIPNGRNERVACTTTGQFELEIIRRLREAFP